ncbi:MAG: hypothetical protein HY301_12855 [Verrucomicrobia bacterium]|nr:hypothetical protein [Verrucomicrobiota bacterium]
MTISWQFFRGLLLLLLFVGCAGWVMWHWLKKTQDDPVVLILKWVVSVALVGVALAAIFTMGPAGPGVGAGCGVTLAWLWRHNVGGFFAGFITSGMDGGDIPPEPKPHYSLAEGMRKRGRYREAAAEVRQQLEKFPGDFQCETMLAEIHAEHLGEFGVAEAALERIANNPQRPPHERAYALNQIADWHLKFHQDPDTARAVLERLQQFLPGTEFARLA